ncbi:MAG: hypothetical protein RR630_10655 [Coprobacillus sp.]
MLKLMKFEMIHSVRTFATSFIIFLLGCVLMPFAIHFLAGNQTSEFILGALGLIFVILTMGILLALFVSVFINYKRSMFERPGYLTLTLPKSNLEIIVSKLIVAIVWIFIGMLVLFGGILLMGLFVSLLEGNLNNIKDIFKALSIVIENINIDAYKVFSTTLLCIAELAFVVSSIYLSISIVHTRWIKKYKTVIAIVIFFVLNMILNMDVFNFVFAISQINMDILYLVIYILSGAVLIILSTYILDHYIEVE